MALSPVSIFGTAEGDTGHLHLYRLQGQPAGRGYDLRVYATDYAGRGWSGSSTLLDLKGLVDDISPEDKQMLQWVVDAAKSNDFKFCRDKDDCYLETEVRAGTFTLKLRLPAEESLEAADKTDLQQQDQELVFGLFDENKEQQQDLVRAQAEAQEARQHVDDLTRQLQQLESKLASAQQALRNSSHRSPAKSQHCSASLGSLDAFSPSQPGNASQSTHAMKRLHADPSIAMSSQAQGQTQVPDDAASQPAPRPDNQTEPLSAQAESSQGGSQSAVANQQEASKHEKASVGHARNVQRGRRGRGRAHTRATKIG